MPDLEQGCLINCSKYSMFSNDYPLDYQIPNSSLSLGDLTLHTFSALFCYILDSCHSYDRGSGKCLTYLGNLSFCLIFQARFQTYNYPLSKTQMSYFKDLFPLGDFHFQAILGWNPRVLLHPISGTLALHFFFPE